MKFPEYSVLGERYVHFEIELPKHYELKSEADESLPRLITPILHISSEGHSPFLRRVKVTLPLSVSVDEKWPKKPATKGKIFTVKESFCQIKSFRFSPVSLQLVSQKTYCHQILRTVTCPHPLSILADQFFQIFKNFLKISLQSSICAKLGDFGQKRQESKGGQHFEKKLKPSSHSSKRYCACLRIRLPFFYLSTILKKIITKFY